jgi:hypothetical protein
MEYEVTKGFLVAGKAYKVGETVTLDTNLAKDLMAMGRVQPKDDKPAVENRAVGLDESVEKPKTRRKKKADPVAEPEVEAEPEAE